MSQEVTIEYAKRQEVRASMDNRANFVVSILVAASLSATLPACQGSEAELPAHQSVLAQMVIPEVVPAVTFGNYTISTGGAPEAPAPVFGWLSSYPVTSSCTWRIAGGSWERPRDRTFEGYAPPFDCRHLGDAGGSFSEGIIYEFEPLGFDIDGGYYYGDVKQFRIVAGLFEWIEEE